MAMGDEDEVSFDVAKGASAVSGVEVVDGTHAATGLAAEDGAHELNSEKGKKEQSVSLLFK